MADPALPSAGAQVPATQPIAAVAPSTGASVLMRYLDLEGVRYVFGIPGAAIANVLDELRRSVTCRYIVCRHESGAAFVADGYWRVSGNLGVLLVTSGPGAVNALNGAVNADCSMSQLLVITGEVDQNFYGRGWEQEGADADLDVASLYKNAVSYSGIVTTVTNLPTILTTALRAARATPGRCAHVSLPIDVQKAPAVNMSVPASPESYRANIQVRDTRAAAEVLRELLNAKRPLIFLGNGCRFALRGERLAPVRALVERFGIPVMTTLDGKGLFPETHRLSLRAYGKSGCMWPALYLSPPPGAPFVEAYDYLLIIGSRLDQFSTNLWNPRLVPKGPMVQVDINQASIGRGMPVGRSVIAEAGAFLEDMVAAAAGLSPEAAPAMGSRLQYLDWMKSNYSPFYDAKAYASNATPVRPERVMALINQLLPPGSHIFADAGNSCGWCSHYLVIEPPTQAHAALELGTMGYSIGAVVGAKLAAPESVCVAVCGDGGFLMHGAEVSTAAAHGIGAIWVVWSENDLNMVSQGMGVVMNDPKDYQCYYSLGKPDIAKIAEGLGAQAHSAMSPQEFAGAFESAIRASRSGKPQVVVVAQDHSAMPPFYVNQFPWDEGSSGGGRV